MNVKNLEEIDPVSILSSIEGDQGGGGEVPSPEVKTPDPPKENLPPFVMDYELPKEMDEDLKQRLLLVEDDMADIEFTNLIGIQAVRNDYKLLKLLTNLESMISKIVAIPENEKECSGPLKTPLEPKPESYPRKNAIKFK